MFLFQFYFFNICSISSPLLRLFLKIIVYIIRQRIVLFVQHLGYIYFLYYQYLNKIKLVCAILLFFFSLVFSISLIYQPFLLYENNFLLFRYFYFNIIIFLSAKPVNNSFILFISHCLL
jgi:hypothetical protein